MSDALILSACRTPIGKFQGDLASVPVPELGAVAVKGAVERAGLDAEVVEEVIMGNVLTAGVGQAPARQAALKAGLPDTVAALTVNKVCGSGLKAVMLAAQAVRCGDADLIVAGGMESMSRAGWLLPRETPKLGDRMLIDTMLHDGLECAFGECSMGVIADATAEREQVTREEQDRYAEQSHRRAMAAIDAGIFDAEIVPVPVRQRGGEVSVSRDEGPRPDANLADLSKLRPAFGKSGTVTAGNASMISDGAAAVVVASRAAAERVGTAPLARILAMTTVGGRPEDLFIAPADAIRKVVSKAGMSLSEIDLFELNEAFASQTIACLKRLELSADRVNVNGGAIALGHPIGASGARVLTTLLYALKKRGGGTGLAALCLGGGNAVAMVVTTERL